LVYKDFRIGPGGKYQLSFMISNETLHSEGVMPICDAVLFDLLTALLDSWSLWNRVAGGEERGLAWRTEYLRRIYAAGAYRPFESLVAEAAQEVALPDSAPQELIRRWPELKPWPDVQEVLGALGVPLGVVTNCSEAAARQAVACVGVEFQVVVSTERAGFYKPHERPYRLALAELGTSPSRTLFVAGSPGDVGGASRVGMPVYWHNPRGLMLPRGSTEPIADERSLPPLVRLVRGS
jgi:2-haloalkanoic acid dehalogenase type II